MITIDYLESITDKYGKFSFKDLLVSRNIDCAIYLIDNDLISCISGDCSEVDLESYKTEVAGFGYLMALYDTRDDNDKALTNSARFLINTKLLQDSSTAPD